MAQAGLIRHQQADESQTRGVNAAGMWAFMRSFGPGLTFLDPVRLREVTQPCGTRQLADTVHVFRLKVQTCCLTTMKKHTFTVSCPYMCYITFFGLRVSDLQVAVPGSQPLPAHDLPLQVSQREVRAVKHHRVVAELRGKFIMNMSHIETELQSRPILPGN